MNNRKNKLWYPLLNNALLITAVEWRYSQSIRVFFFTSAKDYSFLISFTLCYPRTLKNSNQNYFGLFAQYSSHHINSGASSELWKILLIIFTICQKYKTSYTNSNTSLLYGSSSLLHTLGRVVSKKTNKIL